MTWADQIVRHYESSWKNHAQTQPFRVGPVDEISPDFRVVRFPPNNQRDMWTYATAGMSRPDDTKPIELHIFSPTSSELLVELLVVTAHFHRTGALLDLGHTVNFGRPWLPHSECDHGLISLPYLDGPDLEVFDSNEARVFCYWLLPITKSELSFKKKHGLEQLEDLFEKAGLDYVNPRRPSVV